MRFKLGELFSGPGGLGLGAMNAQVSGKNKKKFCVEHGWSSDYDKDSCLTYAHNIKGAKKDTIIHEDVKELCIADLPHIDAFAYGFPCNDFSLVGEQKGFDGKYGPLYTYGVKVIEHFAPKFFVAENVGGMSSANEGKAFEKIKQELSACGGGYTLTAHKYKSEEYGVAQTRHRIIMVGIRNDIDVVFKVPAPTTADAYKSVKKALESPPIPADAANCELTRQSATVIERLKLIKPGQNVWNADLPLNLQLNVKGAKLSQIYRRLHPDKPSYTITGSGGGGTHGYHYKEFRALTNRERARIQSFPDDYVFQGSKESVRKQIGMAVPPLLSQVIFEAILKSFAKIEYETVSAKM